MKVKRLVTGIASAALVASSFVPAAFADSNTIAGNGAWSRSNITADSSNTMIVSQSNDMQATNDVSVSNYTGGNSASGNTGGDVNLRSGDANADVYISNVGGSNVASLGNNCGCENGGTDITIVGNGKGSDNSVDVSQNKFSGLFQENNTDFYNRVNVDNVTGNNDAEDNTSGNGFWINNNFPWRMQNQDWWKTHNMSDWNNSNNGGDTQVRSGNANASVMIYNAGSDNLAQ